MLKFRFLAQVQFILDPIILGVSEHESLSMNWVLSIYINKWFTSLALSPHRLQNCSSWKASVGIFTVVIVWFWNLAMCLGYRTMQAATACRSIFCRQKTLLKTDFSEKYTSQLWNLALQLKMSIFQKLTLGTPWWKELVVISVTVPKDSFHQHCAYPV